MKKRIDTFEPFNFDIPEDYPGSNNNKGKRFLSWFEYWELARTVIVPIHYNKWRVCQATGMSHTELDFFLKSRKFSTDGKYITYEALVSLEKWYIKKLRRYLKNALSSKLESKDKVTFIEFCRRYKKDGTQEVRSWRDIDENLISLEFRAECDGQAPYTSVPYEEDCGYSLLARIYSSFLFHTQYRSFRHRSYLHSVLSFLISHRYHIFTTEDNADADNTNIPFEWMVNKCYNPPRHIILYGLAT